MKLLCTYLLIFSVCSVAKADEGLVYPLKGGTPPYTEFLDKGFPFKELTIAIGGRGEPDREIVPRALIVPLAEDVYVAYDTELMRVAAIWKGAFSEPLGVSFASYALPLNKIEGGFRRLPSPAGKIVSRSGVYPGWQRSGDVRLFDFREAYIDEREPGRGPMDPELASWKGVRVTDDGALLSYLLFGANAFERFQVLDLDGDIVVERRIRVENLDSKATLLLPGPGDDVRSIDIGPTSETSCEWVVRYSLDGDVSIEEVKTDKGFSTAKEQLWPEKAVTSFSFGKENRGYVFDLLDLPYPNPWKRRIRPVDIKFRKDGSAVLLTFDGDLYRLTGFESADSRIVWQRIGAGFNEPQTLALRGDDIFVYSRGGVSRLWDLDGDHEIDRYEMFCNRFVQSPDTRDFPSSIVAMRDGSFLISKCGQQVASRNPHSGRVLKISADGEKVSVYASGLRNAFLAYDPSRDLVTASDQQGEWIPSTPLLEIEEGLFYGYEKSPAATEMPVSPPLLWFPHRVAPSGVGQVHGFDERSISFRNSVLYLEYHRPSIHRVSFAEGNLRKASASQLPLSLEIPLLNGSVNPTDGMAYVAGFQIWDSSAPRLEGIGRIREVEGGIRSLESMEPVANGVVLSYRTPVEPKVALDPNRYQVSAWDYRRTAQYGSAQYNQKGEPGIDSLYVHSVHLSQDRCRVYLAIEAMRPAMQVEVMVESDGKWLPTYLTVDGSNNTPLEALGFGMLDPERLFKLEPAPRAEAGKRAVVSAARGQEIYSNFGCIGCHSTDGSTEGRSGPSFLDLYNSRRHLTDGSVVKATRSYLKESILAPSEKKAKGYDDGDVGMPSYAGILKEDEIESILLFLESL
ncbi:c-type cytochrome [Pelagicoccus sp. NFK12]|uniref:C-type cytochrome n=1 Tax=Pelagicoccus enzymogenes TaxID=2773457 RepID=A0A927IIU4_9BACT|nr:DUF6797 domain-containing protein [Pelagicoccus enzymogenes]MBD5781621.1 c-type cytochrome [Pelagicoccus enzymogenes]